jgi:hypothetical protein
MELFLVLLVGIVLVAATATVLAVLTDGHGQTPRVQSTAPWKAGDLPSEPYAMHADRIPTALWLR